MQDHVFNVDAYAAKGNGKDMDTNAVQAAIRACGEKGGGVVTFTPGKRYLIGTICLESNMTLHVPEGCTIFGSRNIRDYSKDTGLCPYYPEPLDRCLIYAYQKHDIALTGRGRIDGQAIEFLPEGLPKAQGRDSWQRPMLIRLEECDAVSIEHLTLTGAFSWCTHIKKCRGVKLNKVNISNERQDGFNIESSSEIVISNCNLKCGDDGIALTTSDAAFPLRNLTVYNCMISSRWAAVRIGPLSKGNFENIILSNCVFRQCGGGGIKIGMYEGAQVRNCIFSNIVMDEVTAPISIFLGTWSDIGSPLENPPMMPVGDISNLQFNDIYAVAKAGPVPPWRETDIPLEKHNDLLNRPDNNSTLFFHGHPQSRIRNVTLNNVHVVFPGGGTEEQAVRRIMVDMDQIDIHGAGFWTDNKNIWGIAPSYGLYARHFDRLTLNNTTFELNKEDRRASIFCYESANLEISHVRSDVSEGAPAMMIFKRCSEVDVHDCKALRPTGAYRLQAMED